MHFVKTGEGGGTSYRFSLSSLMFCVARRGAITVGSNPTGKTGLKVFCCRPAAKKRDNKVYGTFYESRTT